MKDQKGVTSRGGAIVVKYDGRSLMPVCPTPEDDIDNQSKPLDLFSGGCLFISCNFMIKLVQLKYHGEKGSPFEKHRFLMCAFIVALIMVGLTLAVLGYDYGRSLYKNKSFPRHVYKVLRSIMYLSAIIALLLGLLMFLAN